MKWIICLSVLFFSCKNDERKNVEELNVPAATADTLRVDKPENKKEAALKEYSNTRFRHVTVEKVNENQFRVRGEGQIFEASFNWVIEDGHNELKKGYQMTDAGAPEWGKFDFTVDAPQTMNATLTLILFETSAMDGSRQHELPIALR